MSAITYVTVAITTLRDLGTIEAAARYCEMVAAQNGVDAIVYKFAAESLRDVEAARLRNSVLARRVHGIGWVN